METVKITKTAVQFVDRRGRPLEVGMRVAWRENYSGINCREGTGVVAQFTPRFQQVHIKSDRLVRYYRANGTTGPMTEHVTIRCEYVPTLRAMRAESDIYSDGYKIDHTWIEVQP